MRVLDVDGGFFRRYELCRATLGGEERQRPAAIA
jgi:hypothetical protein